MQRANGVKQVKCHMHDFKLCPLNDAIYNAQYYNVSFCTCKYERVGRKQSKTIKTTKNLTFPMYNHDNNYSTPAFILNSQRNYYESEGNKMKQEHQKKMEDYTESKAEINVPKPRTKNNYCSVCKTNYEDYLEHIHADLHKRKINQSIFNKDILDLTYKYPQNTPKRNRNSSRDIVYKTGSVTRIQDDSDQVQIISNPHKQIKPNEIIKQTTQTSHVSRPNHCPFPPNYPNDLSRINQYPFPINAPINLAAATNAFPPPLNHFPLINSFKPFSSTYQQQMNQFILNLNIIFNPYPLNPMFPQQQPNLLTPFQLSIQAKQQLNMLQYSLLNQISFCNKLQNSLPVGGEKTLSKATCIVIDE